MGGDAVRERILDAAFGAFITSGYAATSTAEIAARAHVSKRELYNLVGNKKQMLVACISERAKRLRAPANLPEVRDRESLAQVLVALGTQMLREVTDPMVIAAFRLAIAEAPRAPEVAQTLDSIGRETSRAALRGVMGEATTLALLKGNPAELEELFGALLLGDLLVSLLLGVAKRPNAREITKRTENAAAAFLQLKS